MFQPEQFGTYTLLSRLAIGGMAELFVAFDGSLKGPRLVVVKRILAQYTADADFVQMFQDECRITATLKSSNIVRVLDHGQIDDTLFLAMELVEGCELGTLEEAARKAEDPLSPEEGAWVMAQVCRGLDYAHSKTDERGRPLEIVHRDVTPPNLLISGRGQVRVTDFGIAKAAQKLSVTRAGMMKGKLGYMSPELVAGRKVDRRADIFGAGIILWDILAGRQLFDGETEGEVLGQLAECKVPPPSQFNRAVTKDLDAIVVRALKQNPDERFSTAGKMADALEQFLGGRGFAEGQMRISDRVEAYFGAENQRRAQRTRKILEEQGLELLESSDATEVSMTVSSLGAGRVRRTVPSDDAAEAPTNPARKPLGGKTPLVDTRRRRTVEGVPAAPVAPPEPPGRSWWKLFAIGALVTLLLGAGGVLAWAFL